MPFKKNNWLNTETNEELYGIDAKVNGKWCYTCEGAKPLLFKTEQERNVKLATLQRLEKELEKEGSSVC